MIQFPMLARVFVSATLAILLPQPAMAATGKKSPGTAKKRSTADAPAKKKAVAEAPDSATPADAKNNSTPPLDLPLPAKLPGATETSSAAEKKSTESPEAGAKPPEKPGSESAAKRGPAPNATVEPDAIAEFAAQPSRIQQLIRDAIDLTRLNLTYIFGSSDPDNGGMDCSGAIYYLLHAHGLNDVARDSSGQYLWARKSGIFYPVVSKSADSVEFNELQPGDLMFWTGTYETGKDVPISHVMLYLGREKETGNRIMFGASDGRSYHGVQRTGVSVFDFKMPKADPAHPEKAHPEFIGFARIPGLRAGASRGSETVAAAASAHDPAKPAPKSTATNSKKKKGSSRSSK